MKILVTAGPTREYLDDVRFISNPSTGKMGFEVARAAARAGHRVTLISGPTHLTPPERVRFIPVVSAQDMYEAVLKVFPSVDAVLMTAAVGDYAPAVRRKGKMKKAEPVMSLKLRRTRDILKTLGQRKRSQTLIGFALEVDDPVHHAQTKPLDLARGKLAKKHLDYVVLNGPEAFGSDTIKAAILHKGGRTVFQGRVTKKSLAKRLIQLLNS